MGFRVFKLYGLACLWVLLALGIYMGILFKLHQRVLEPVVSAPPPPPKPQAPLPPSHAQESTPPPVPAP
uniref:hypothetical protein n=1 Tax=Helicobacter salomonis TaxID=56878 RepID=UPI001F469399